ncbi:pentachlorophenol monooxygenase, partial [Klenkia sp. PcliD-1-E]|nr:pentachlorophenol monooxygenase [Klenkia sp. PcliD-1-E]
PDVPVVVPGRPDLTRLRQLAREGLTVLLAAEAPDVPAPDADGPVSVRRIDDLDPSGLLAGALGACADEIWVLRPDAHVAAVLTDPADLPAALARITRTLQRTA